jgi:hypothetical protein
MSAAIAGTAVVTKAAALSNSFFMQIPHHAGPTSINNFTSTWLLCGDAAALMSQL